MFKPNFRNFDEVKKNTPTILYFAKHQSVFVSVVITDGSIGWSPDHPKESWPKAHLEFCKREKKKKEI